MNKSFQKLENQMVRYKDLTLIKTKDVRERFVYVKDIPFGYQKRVDDMKKPTKNRIFVRETVYQKLLNSQIKLKKINKNLSLFITYGYRDINIQTKRFLKRLKVISTVFFDDPLDLYEEIHRYVAVPTVSGHPTGGAVDTLIIDSKTGIFLDFGTKIYDYRTKDCYVFTPNISREATNNRLSLRNCMLSSGFAPFDGEWWHFSYGDREWAFYYKKKLAIYNQVSLKKMLYNFC